MADELLDDGGESLGDDDRVIVSIAAADGLLDTADGKSLADGATDVIFADIADELRDDSDSESLADIDDELLEEAADESADADLASWTSSLVEAFDKSKGSTCRISLEIIIFENCKIL